MKVFFLFILCHLLSSVFGIIGLDTGETPINSPAVK